MKRFSVVFALTLLISTGGFAANSLPVGSLNDEKIQGWSVEGNAWGQTNNSRPGIMTKFHAESIAGGEKAVGTLRSDPFTITCNAIIFSTNGWNGQDGDKKVNHYYLRRASDGEILRSAVPPCSDGFARQVWYVNDLIGQKVYIEAIDGDTGDAYAWLGLGDVYQISYKETKLKPYKLTVGSQWGVMTKNGFGSTVAPYLSSLVNGEQGTGDIDSPTFTVATDTIRFDICGHDGDNGGARGNFICLKDAKTDETLLKTYAPGSDQMQPCRWDVKAFRGRQVYIHLHDGVANDGFSWFGVNNIDAGPAFRVTFKGTGVPAGWHTGKVEMQYANACGVPFTALPLGQSMVSASGLTKIACGFSARKIYLLGLTNSWDHGNPCWNWPSDETRLFIGDKAGDLVIKYADGTKDTIPLVFGKTMWWYANYTGMGAVEPFASDPKAKAALDSVLDVYPTGQPGSHAYLCAIQPRQKRIEAIAVVDNPKKKGAPVIAGITFDTESKSSLLGSPSAAPPATDEEISWLAKHTISSASPVQKDEVAKLAALKRMIYSYPELFTKPVAVDIPAGFRGPKITFKGDAYADVLTGIYYGSTQDADDKVDPNGVFHTSTYKAPSFGSYEGFGSWVAQSGPYYDHAWSRDLGRVLMELTQLGYDSDSSACAAWCNEQLMWFPRQFPKVNVEGKPTPGHWVRIINHPEMVQTPGMPKDFGNLENDGHGLIMLFEYQSWVNSGRKPEYVQKNWDYIKEAAEYVCWLFDHPEISKAKKNALYSESEGGGNTTSIYCDFPCWLGMQAYADMAKAAGKTDEEKRWRSYADRLKDGFNSYYPTDDKNFGNVWDPAKAAVWPFGHGVLAPIITWPDYYGFDLSSMPQDWLRRSYNTYRLQLSKCHPKYASGIAMGYGQCFITEAALLLDEMKDAEGCLQWLDRFTYLPGCKPFIVPEGAEIDESHYWWHRTGDLGNGVQEGEGIKCVRLVLGIDDTDPERTRFMPRLPLSWNEVEAKDYPVTVQTKGGLEKRKVSFSMKRSTSGDAITIQSDGPLTGAAIRLGPYAPTVKSVLVSVNGVFDTKRTVRSGDSSWAWLELPQGMQALSFTVKAK